MNSAESINIPDGKAAKVSIIDTGARINKIPTGYLVQPPVEGFDYFPTIPSWSFLIETTSGRKALFDLGIPKDWRNRPPAQSDSLKNRGWSIEVDREVQDILPDHGIPVDSIDSVVWSHWHWDHIGNISAFPPNTELVVGPGFKDAFLPGYPTKADSVFYESHFSGRNLREISFQQEDTLQIGSFKAMDFFGDGSFYVLDAPGHAIGHLAALVRTTDNPSSFLFFGGDMYHHLGELRPSPYMSLPKLARVQNVDQSIYMCPGELVEKLQQTRGRSVNEPILDPSMGLSIPETIRTIQKAQHLDAKEEIFFLSAHDDAILGTVDLFPLEVNYWHQKGWRAALQWTFLRDFFKSHSGTT